jgi:hypothetical protein
MDGKQNRQHTNWICYLKILLPIRFPLPEMLRDMRHKSETMVHALGLGFPK